MAYNHRKRRRNWLEFVSKVERLNLVMEDDIREVARCVAEESERTSRKLKEESSKDE